jgi:glutathione peroxidase
MSLPQMSLNRLDGSPCNLADFDSKVLLIVNVASACGFTPQYKDLEALYRAHQSQGLVVMGFPCNQFGGQEPGSPQEIATFCSQRFDVTFPLFEKCEVNGANTHPLFQFLKQAAPGVLGTESIKWNFTKFLVDRSGAVNARFGSADGRNKIEPALLRCLEVSA